MALNLTPQQPMTAEQMQAEARRLADEVEQGPAADDGRERITTALPPRFASYLRDRAAAHGDTPENHLAGILRQFWMNDPWRLTDNRPREMGEPAGSGRR